jgi:hypothetical protein
MTERLRGFRKHLQRVEEHLGNLARSDGHLERAHQKWEEASQALTDYQEDNPYEWGVYVNLYEAWATSEGDEREAAHQELTSHEANPLVDEEAYTSVVYSELARVIEKI